LYSKIVAALSRKAPFERSGLLELSQALGAAWPVGGDLVCRFIHRWAERAADPGAFVPVDPAEKVLLDRLAEEGGLSGASTAWEIARRMRAETDAERLDARYAPYRLLLAVEHGVKAAKKAKGAAA